MFFLGSLQAQWRVQLQGGPTFNPSNLSKDSLLFGDKAKHIQLKATYFWGHLGFGVVVGGLMQDVRSNITTQKPPLFNIQLLDSLRSQGGGGIKSINFLAGPELCFTCSKRIKVNAGFKAGVSILKKQLTTITGRIDQTPRLIYQNELISKAPFTFSAGIGVHYFLSPHLAIGVAGDYLTFKIKAANRDVRYGISNIRTLTQRKHFINAGASIIYKF